GPEACCAWGGTATYRAGAREFRFRCRERFRKTGNPDSIPKDQLPCHDGGKSRTARFQPEEVDAGGRFGRRVPEIGGEMEPVAPAGEGPAQLAVRGPLQAP